MMERKATKPGVSRLYSDPDKPVVIPVEGKSYTLLILSFFTVWK